MTAPARFSQADLTRAVKGLTNAGMRVTSVRIDPNGAIMVMTDAGRDEGRGNPLDRILRQ